MTAVTAAVKQPLGRLWQKNGMVSGLETAGRPRPARTGLLARFATSLRERRLFPRIARLPLLVVIDGRRYRTLDWSLGGFRIARMDRPVHCLDRLSGTVLGLGREAEFVAEVTSVAEDGSVGVRFLELSPAVLIGLSGIRP